jgi:copper chaperone CopZ
LTFQRLEAADSFQFTGMYVEFTMSMTENLTMPDRIALKLTGMTCGGCARAIERVLSRVPGVKSAKVDFGLGLAVVSGAASAAELIAAIEAAGYGAQPIDRTLTG